MTQERLRDAILTLLRQSEYALDRGEVRRSLPGRTPPLRDVKGAVRSLYRDGLIERNADGDGWVIAEPDEDEREDEPAEYVVQDDPDAPAIPSVEDILALLEAVPISAAAGRLPDAEQDAVVNQPVDARCVVEAGPGYGKTDVACARVAQLIEDGVAPPQILLLSFSKTAVREMRARIKQLASAGADVRGVEIRTLDSFAWRIRTAYISEPGETRRFSYKESISAAVEALDPVNGDAEARARVAEYLNAKAHVFVDEAQDLVGARVQLVASFLALMPKSAGWTVFFDPAQAIYDWSEVDEDGAMVPPESILTAIERRGFNPQFHKLETFYRTSEATLKSMLKSARQLVLGPTTEDRAVEIRRMMFNLPGMARGKLSYPELCDLVRELGPLAERALILFRTRGEAITLSSYLAGAGLPHRLRYGGLPQTVDPWVAVCLNRLNRPTFRRSEFQQAFDGIDNAWLTQGWDSESAWLALRKIGAEGWKVKTRDVANRLAWSSLPDELSQREIGRGGPVVGTIHGSKGREAPLVILCVPSDSRGKRDGDEESRVLYVGLSRAKRALMVCDKQSPRFGYGSSGRVWHPVSRGRLKMELGRDGDVDAIGALLADGGDASTLQGHLEAFSGDAVQLNICLEPDAGAEERAWRRVLYTGAVRDEDSAIIGSLSNHFSNSVMEIAKKFWKGTSWPNYFMFGYWLDVTTVAIHEDDHRLDDLDIPEPWRSTRTWLAPVVSGMPMTFPKKKS